MDQAVEYINIGELVLWTENPRDPIDASATDQDIIDKAIDDKRGRWALRKLAKEMGEFYDYSELPTVVYKEGKPIVYDGNRRVILGKIGNGYATISDMFELPEYPAELPCNVCTEEIALQSIIRKHGGSGTWTPLDRDIFLHKFMKQPKSHFLKLDECTGLISNNPTLNRGFVKKEIFNPQKLLEMGFDFDDDVLISKHTNEEAQSIFEDIINQVESENISTRKNRGQIISLLDPENRSVIEKNKNNTIKKTAISFSDQRQSAPRKTKRTKKKHQEIFGTTLTLRPGDVSNLNRDILDLYYYYLANKAQLSNSFPSLIRMSLRLICETASKECNNQTIEKYIRENFTNAKKLLDTNQKTTLSNQNVSETTLIQLLHTGAHNYSAANNFDQTIAISIILGVMLNLTHGKEK